MNRLTNLHDYMTNKEIIRKREIAQEIQTQFIGEKSRHLLDQLTVQLVKSLVNLFIIN